MNNRRLVGVALAGAATVIASHARAFDSAGADFHMRTHVPKRVSPDLLAGLPREPLPTHDIFMGPGAHYVVRLQREALGGGGKDDGVVRNLMRCPDAAISSGSLDVSSCQPLPPSDDPLSNLGWVKARRRWDLQPPDDAWNDGHAAEHAVLADLAAQAAGLSGLPLFKDTLWVRYPAYEGYTASALGPPKEGAPGPDYVVAPFWTPATFSLATSHVLRGFKLTELAQMPDVSNTVWDWASGNEHCPFTDLDENGVNFLGGKGADGKADGKYNGFACHDFARFMGPVNASHFPPLAREFYRYYHQLALTRIRQCKDLAPVTQWYDTLDRNFTAGFWRRTWSKNDNEVQVCEREAFTYELFAVHFLQDSWATGHMWKRWGTTTLGSFPKTFGDAFVKFTGVDDETDMPEVIAGTGDVPESDIPAENVIGRRYILAGLTAGYSGMLHGARSVAADLARNELSWFYGAGVKGLYRGGDTVGQYLDDPLSAPLAFYPWDPDETPARSVSFLFGGAKHAGVGDMFVTTWAPGVLAGRSTRRLLGADTAVEQQRFQLTMCTASSLLEVYNAGPQAHGAPAAVEPIVGRGWSPRTAVADAPDCWGARATNASMFGALGPLHLRRHYKIASGTPEPADRKSKAVEQFNAYVNTILVGKIQAGVSLPDVTDRGLFLLALGERVVAEHSALTLKFAANALTAPDGAESAELTYEGQPIAFVGVKPNLSATSSEGLPAPFVDQPASAPSEAPYDPAQYVARMFWRGHLRDVCFGQPPLPPLPAPDSSSGSGSSTTTDPSSTPSSTGTYDPPAGGGGESGGGGAGGDLGSPDDGPGWMTKGLYSSSTLAELRHRCIHAAAFGGDPSACTACVELAEPNIPTCHRGVIPDEKTPGMYPSKCQLLGVNDTGGLPEYWFNRDYRVSSSNGTDCDQPPSQVAISWCTGTTKPLTAYDNNETLRTQISTAELAKSACPRKDLEGNDVTPSLWTHTDRVAVIHHEHPQSDDGPPFAGTTVVAINVKYTQHEIKEGADGSATCWVYSTTDRADTWLKTGDGPLVGMPEWNEPTSSDGLRTMMRLTPDESLILPFWGGYQRVTAWNRSCATASELAGGGLVFRGAPAAWSPATGYEAFDTLLPGSGIIPAETWCTLAEPFKWKPSCPAGAVPSNDGTCSFGLAARTGATDVSLLKPRVDVVQTPADPDFIPFGDRCQWYRRRTGMDLTRMEAVRTVTVGSDTFHVYRQRGTMPKEKELDAAMLAARLERDNVYMVPAPDFPAVDALLGGANNCRALQFKDVDDRFVNEANFALESAQKNDYSDVHVYERIKLAGFTTESLLARWRNPSPADDNSRPKDFKGGIVTLVRVFPSLADPAVYVDMPLDETPVAWVP